jgi:hypothetical protein
MLDLCKKVEKQRIAGLSFASIALTFDIQSYSTFGNDVMMAYT